MELTKQLWTSRVKALTELRRDRTAICHRASHYSSGQLSGVGMSCPKNTLTRGREAGA